MQPKQWLYNPHDEQRRVGWLELFYDLVFVATLIELGNLLSNDVSVQGFFQFVLLFIPVWWTWAGITFFTNRFLIDDLLHRLMILGQMLALASMAISIQGAFDNLGNQFVMAYVLARSMLVLLYVRSWLVIEEVRPLVSGYISGFSLGIVAWLVSLLFDGTLQYALWTVGVLIELGTPFTPHMEKWQMKYVPHLEHMVERYGIFSIIVLGESFLKIIDSQAGQVLSLEQVLTGALIFLIASSIWWLYFDDISSSEINAGSTPLYIWIYFHLPLAIGITAFGVAAKKVMEQLSDKPLQAEYRLLFVGVLIIYLIAVTVIDEVTSHAERSNQSRTIWRASGALLLAIAAFALAGATPIVVSGVVALIFILQVAQNVLSNQRHLAHSLPPTEHA